MPRGGRRIGAGRKRGSKTARTADVALKAAENGQTPVEYMLGVMRDETQPQSVRLQAAGMAAPYVHPRLAHIHQTRTTSDALKKLYEQVTERLGHEPGECIEGAAVTSTLMITDATGIQDEHTE